MATANKQTPSLPQPIEVAKLTLRDEFRVNFIGKAPFSSDQVFDAGKEYKLEYRPWMRHHSITHIPTDSEVMVHESWCTWIGAQPQ